MPDLGERVVKTAREWIGTPFAWGASVKGAGCDCRGLLSGVARDLGLPEADTFEATWNGYGASVPEDMLRDGIARLFDPAAEWMPGDVLLIALAGHAQHLAIYCGEGRMIHTYSRGPERVIEVPMGTAWKRAVISAWRWRDGNS